MRHLSGQKGAALVVVMAMVVISTAVFAVVLNFIQRGTETSSLEQKYETAKDASFGALDVFAKEVIPTAIAAARVDPTTSLSQTLGKFYAITSAQVAAGTTDVCFSDKLLKSTADWTAGCSSTTDPKTLPDMTFTLQGANNQPFVVYMKIVDTVPGNSDTSGTPTALYSPDPVASSGTGLMATTPIPYLYSMEVQGERQQNPQERARLEVLYAY